MGKAVGANLQLLVSQNLDTCHQSHCAWSRRGPFRHQLLYAPVDWKRPGRTVPSLRGKWHSIKTELAARRSQKLIRGDRVWQLHPHPMPKICSSKPTADREERY